MDLTVEEILNQLDDLMDSMSYHDNLSVAIDVAQQLRDELMMATEVYDE
jgi:hypothetical protein